MRPLSLASANPDNFCVSGLDLLVHGVLSTTLAAVVHVPNGDEVVVLVVAPPNVGAVVLLDEPNGVDVI